MTLLQILSQARLKGKPIFHFNVSTYEQFKAFAELSSEYPLIVGTSEGERKYFDLEQLIQLVKLERGKGKQLFINADHSRTLESAKKAALLGCDAVLLDIAEKSYQENLKQTKELVKFAREQTLEVLVESELGYLRGHSSLIKEAVEIKPSDLTDPDQAAEFVKETGVDLFAPAVGNLHGISLVTYPRLDFERLKKIHQKVSAFLVLHGASGIELSDLKKAVDCGINIIHINTELRLSWRKSLEASLKRQPEVVAPYEILKEVVQAIKEKAKEYLEMFK